MEWRVGIKLQNVKSGKIIQADVVVLFAPSLHPYMPLLTLHSDVYM